MKNIFNIIALLGALFLISFSCATGEYDAIYSAEANLNEKNEACTDYRDIYFNNTEGLGCSESETMNRYIGTWEASIEGNSSEKYQIEITNHYEEYRINVKTNFGFSMDGKRGNSSVGKVRPVEFVLDVKNRIAEFEDSSRGIRINDIDISLIIFRMLEGETPKIIISASTSGDKSMVFKDNVERLELLNKIQTPKEMEIY